MKIAKRLISTAESRIQKLQNIIANQSEIKFHQLSVIARRNLIRDRFKINIQDKNYNEGGLDLDIADSMSQNVIGIQALPLSIIPNFVINKRLVPIVMSIEQPSVVAACSAIGKLIAPFSFYTQSTPSIMIGQVHLPNCEMRQINQILVRKQKIIHYLNQECFTMVKRGGGVKQIKIYKINGQKEYAVNIYINVCQAMGANIVNTIAEKCKQILTEMGLQTGIAILTNYCIQRRSKSQFQIPVSQMSWKKYPGKTVVSKIIEAYNFAKNDIFRAATHNKGIMNGIDAVCLATGQDWRAVESAAHCYACRSGKYQPLSHFQLIQKNGLQYFRGILEIPISVGTLGGAINKNPIYKDSLALMGNPTSTQLGQIIVSVGLAQNVAALRALATEGIQKGHMNLHNKRKQIIQIQNEITFIGKQEDDKIESQLPKPKI